MVLLEIGIVVMIYKKCSQKKCITINVAMLLSLEKLEVIQ